MKSENFDPKIIIASALIGTSLFATSPIIRKDLSRIENSISSANVISNLTEDLLTLAKIKNNFFELNIESNVNLLEIVYEAFQVLSFNANSKNISFELEHQKNRRFIV